MTHSSHARRRDVIEARNYEVTLSRMIAEQKDRAAIVSMSGDFDLMKSELEICQKLEKFRRDLLAGGADKTSADAYMVDTLVRARVPECSCMPQDFQPGQYCGDCGVYRPDGDEF